MKFRLFGITDVGRVRDHNEDNFAICKDLSEGEWNFDRDEVRDLSDRGTIMVVADGMGGTNAGEIASDLAQKSVKDQFDALAEIPKEDEAIIEMLNGFILKAHQAIVNHQNENLDTAGMGTTLVIAWVLRGKLYTSWSGDSRCYIFNPNSALYPFTDDHSHVWEMVKNDQLTPEQARVHPESNLITQNLGDANQTPKPEGKVIDLNPGDRVLVCSDGLNGMISDAEIHYILLEENSTSEACKKLVEEAKRAGGHDNITVLLMDIDPGKKHSGSSVPRTTASFQSAPGSGSGGSLGTYLGALALALAAVLTYHFMFQPDTQPATPKTIALKSQAISLGKASTTWLDPEKTFLPYGPDIVRAEIGQAPQNGKATVEGQTISYTPDKDGSQISDVFTVRLHGEDGLLFTASYILDWDLPVAEKKTKPREEETKEIPVSKADEDSSASGTSGSDEIQNGQQQEEEGDGAIIKQDSVPTDTLETGSNNNL